MTAFQSIPPCIEHFYSHNSLAVLQIRFNRCDNNDSQIIDLFFKLNTRILRCVSHTRTEISAHFRDNYSKSRSWDCVDICQAAANPQYVLQFTATTNNRFIWLCLRLTPCFAYLFSQPLLTFNICKLRWTMRIMNKTRRLFNSLFFDKLFALIGFAEFLHSFSTFNELPYFYDFSVRKLSKLNAIIA